ncbi:unnamed protein product [Nezara viridula]|uniref:Uncharacterized protein n=1 Tax=Nezara viridula TaxID=85310 RepID=A0A9P0H2Y5_NEZVI|nr:unnamed protein product [Nezara viridula]
MGPAKNIPLSLECKTKNSNDKCKQATARGGTFLTNLEGTSLGPGFPPKPVGLLVRPNVSREVPSTSAPEDKFLVDDKPPMPPPPLKRRPLPKGRIRRPFLDSSERQDSSQEAIDPIILGPLFYEDIHNPESTSQAGENNHGASQENFNGSGERNRALLDSFNELDHPDPKLLSKFKGKLYPKYFAEKRNLEQKEKEELHGSNEEKEESDENTEEADNSKEEDENSAKSVEEEEPVPVEEAPDEETSEDYESSKEEENQDNFEEEHSSHHSTEEESNEEEEEEPVSVSEPGNQASSEEDENPPKEHSVEEEKTEDSEEEEKPEDSEEEEKPEDFEEEGNLPPDTPPEEGLDSPTSVLRGSNGSSESNAQNSSNSREEEVSESEESTTSEGQNTASGEAVHSTEESTEDTDYTDYSINNDIDSSAPSEGDTYHPSAEEETSDESNESKKTASSSEDTNEIRPSSIESQEEVNEDYGSREEHSQENHSQESGEQQSEEQQSQEGHSHEEHSQEEQSQEQHSQEHSQEQQSEENPDKPPNEYDEEADEESPRDYYDMPDYDNTSSEYEEIFPKPEQEPTKKPQVYYKKRPATFYYIVGGSGGQKEDPKKESDDVDNGSKPLDYEDNKIKQSEEVDSSTPSAEDHPSSSSDENFSSMGFESFDLDSVLKKPKVHDDKTTRSPVAVISITTPQSPTTKCDDNDAKKNEDSEDQKRLKTPLGTPKPNTIQPGDVVSITRSRPVNFGLSPTTPTTTSTFRPATISAIGIVKPDGSIIAKVVSPRPGVQSSTSSAPTKMEGAQEDAGTRSTQVPWKTLLAAREATALTYLKPPPIGQQQTWFLRQARAPRSVDFLSRPL